MRRFVQWIRIFWVLAFWSLLLGACVGLLWRSWGHPWFVGAEGAGMAWLLWRVLKNRSAVSARAVFNGRNRHMQAEERCPSPASRFQPVKGNIPGVTPAVPGFPVTRRPPRLGADYEWVRGSQVKAGFLENCEVAEVLDNPLHYYLYSAQGKKVTFFPHKGLRRGWVDEP